MTPLPSTTAAIVAQVIRLLTGISMLMFALAAWGLGYAVATGADLPELTGLLETVAESLMWLGLGAAGIAGTGAVARKAPDAAAGLGGAVRAWRGTEAPTRPQDAPEP